MGQVEQPFAGKSKRSGNRENSEILAILKRIVGLIVVTSSVLLGIWFFSGQLLIGGVPSSIILTFLQDQPALTAYFQNNDRALHDRLNELGIEDQIKAYYRPQIPDEAKLDQYIHQVFYNRTGYVGEDYEVSEQGTLTLKQRP
jgi:hypothetical protein